MKNKKSVLLICFYSIVLFISVTFFSCRSGKHLSGLQAPDSAFVKASQDLERGFPDRIYSKQTGKDKQSLENEVQGAINSVKNKNGSQTVIAVNKQSRKVSMPFMGLDKTNKKGHRTMNSKAVQSLLLTLGGLLVANLILIPILGGLLAMALLIGGFVLALLALKQIKENPGVYKGQGFAIATIVLFSIVVLAIIVGLVLFSTF